MNNTVMSVKEIRQQYKADARFVHPAMIKLLNTTNRKNDQYFYLSKKLKQLKHRDNIKIQGHVVLFPRNSKIVIIDDKAFRVSYLENKVFNYKHIVKRYTKKYKLWISIKYLKR